MSTDAGAALTKLIEQLTARHGPEPADPSADLCPNGCDGPLHELVYSFMLWEASHELAGGAVSGLLEAFVDYNELRICYPEEMVPALGAKYPRAEERCARLHAALHDIFVRENGVSLARLRDQGKRDARAFLGALEGVPGFVAARVAVVSLGAHAFPVDDRISAILLGAGVGEEDTSNDELSGGSSVCCARARRCPRTSCSRPRRARRAPTNPKPRRAERSRVNRRPARAAEARPPRPAPGA
ncbi:MAG: hypothetical protein R3B49_09325 [Phycisphaerales bacterium]